MLVAALYCCACVTKCLKTTKTLTGLYSDESYDRRGQVFVLLQSPLSAAYRVGFLCLKREGERHGAGMNMQKSVLWFRELVRSAQFGISGPPSQLLLAKQV